MQENKMTIYYVNGQPKDQNASLLYNTYWQHVYRERSQFLGSRKVIDYYKYNYFQAFKDVEKQLKNKVSQYKTSTSVRIAMGETCQGAFCFDRSEINGDDYDVLDFAKDHMITEAKTSEVFFPDQTLKLQKKRNETIIVQKPIKMRKITYTLSLLGHCWEQQEDQYETEQMQSVISSSIYNLICNDKIYGYCFIELGSNYDNVFPYVISNFTFYTDVVSGSQHNSKLKSDKTCVFWTKNSQNLTSYYGEDVVGLPKICSFDPCYMFSSESSESCSSISSYSSESSNSSISSYSSDSSLSSQSSDSSLSSVSSYSSENSFSSQGSTNSENSYSSFNSCSSEVSINSLDSQYSFESSSSNESDSSFSSYSSESSESSFSSQSSGLKIAYPEQIIHCDYYGSIASYMKYINQDQMTGSYETLVITKEEYDRLADNQKEGFLPCQFNNYVRCPEDDYLMVYDVVLKQVVYDEYNNIDKIFCRAYDNEGNYIDFQLPDNWQNGFYFNGYECKRQQDWFFMQDGYVDGVAFQEAHIFIYNPTYEAIKPTLS